MDERSNLSVTADMDFGIIGGSDAVRTIFERSFPVCVTNLDEICSIALAILDFAVTIVFIAFSFAFNIAATVCDVAFKN